MQLQADDFEGSHCDEVQLAAKAARENIEGGVEWLMALQRRVLRELFFEDEGEMISLFESAVVFAQTFRRALPKPDQFNEFVSLLSELRHIVDLHVDDARSAESLPKDWPDLASRVFSIICLGFEAYTDVAEMKDMSQVPLTVWPLAKIEALMSDLQGATTSAENGQLEAATMKDFIERIPYPLREAMDLPTSTAAYSRVVADAAAMQQRIFRVVEKARLAWIEHCMQEGDISTKVTFSGAFSGGGLLLQLRGMTDLLQPLEADVVRAACEAVDAKTPGAVEQLKTLEKTWLTHLLPCDKATAGYIALTDFAATFRGSRTPDKTELQDTVTLLPNALRAALGVNTDDKFTKKIRPAGWQRDARVVFSVFCLAYTAWHPDGRDSALVLDL